MAARAGTDLTEEPGGSWRRVRAWLRRVTRRRTMPAAPTGERATGSPAPESAPALRDAPAEVLAAVGAACEGQQRLQFDFSGRDGAESLRDVEPYRLVRSGAYWYLLAYDVGRDDWRTFRLDRMRPRTTTGPTFAPRPMPTGEDAPYLASVGEQSETSSRGQTGGGRADRALVPEPGVVEATAEWARRMLAPGAAVVIDTETTDLPGAICEIAVVDAATGDTLLDTLVDPRVTMSPRAVAVHGIAEVDLVGAPTWAAVLPRLLEVTAGRQVLAYNVEFDSAVIRADSARYGLSLGGLEAADRWECVMLNRAQTLPGGTSLALGAGHRARGDAIAALEVLRELAALAPSVVAH